MVLGGIELLCDLAFLEPVIQAPHGVEKLPEFLMGGGIVGIKFDSCPVFFLHPRPVPRIELDLAQRHQGI